MRKVNTAAVKSNRIHIPAEHIHETVVPSHLYQKVENGFRILPQKVRHPVFALDDADADKHPPIHSTIVNGRRRNPQDRERITPFLLFLTFKTAK